MKVHVLVDNNTLIDKYFLAEPGFSLLIEESGFRILFDTGYFYPKQSENGSGFESYKLSCTVA